MVHKILPVYSSHSLDQSLKVLRASYKAGLRRFEFTNRNYNALEIFSKLIEEVNGNMPGMELGAGTIMNISDAENFIKIGARFLISPLISKELIDYSQTNNIEWLPGCATGAEIGLAQNAGIPMVKLYPIKTLGGVEFVKLMKGPFYKMKFQTSGGIKGEPQEVKELLTSGVSIVGLGNTFFEDHLSELDLEHKIKNLLDQI
jgi:2-dehydro-3-deoxyphosphogluconate aldolase / (4S)-4-hydroxy-2-oxoglutarate aldolase